MFVAHACVCVQIGEREREVTVLLPFSTSTGRQYVPAINDVGPTICFTDVLF